ncbi:MAG: elongation factor G [Phycisphaerales bacterium]|nr:MAG: elongation factor G [Phycisphaerales bacterium]
MAYTTADIRNIALVGHSHAGKTSLAERLLVDTKAKGRLGTVDEGNTTCDYEAEEKAHKHSLNSALVHFDHDGRHINLIDTPGSPDFYGQALTSLPAVETTCVVIDAVAGVQMNTRRLMKMAEERRLPRMIVINKIDHDNIDLPGLLNRVRETFGPACVPINLPTKGATDVVDLLEAESGSPDFSTFEEARTQLLDQIVEVDEALMAVYLEDPKKISDAQLHAAIEKALRESHLIPVCFCSAQTGAGIDDLLHIFTHVCPNPLEGNPRPFQHTSEGEESEWHAEADSSKPVVAHVFKVTTDPFVGKLSFFRVHQGTVKASSQLLLGDQKKPLRIGHIFKVIGKDHTEVKELIAGDIGAVAKLDDLRWNGVLHESHEMDDLRLKPLPLPRPMSGLALVAKSRNDETKIGAALQKLAEEDPTFHVERVASTHELVIRGLGDLHLRVMIEKLKNHFGVEVETHPPKVAYKETIRGKAEGHHRHKKQTGGAGQFGEVYLRVEPLPHDHETGFEFADETFGGSVPKQFLPAIEKGVRKVLETGAIAGFPLTGVRVAVYDGKHHPVDSKEVAFVTAGKKAFIDAVSKAKPALLEPFVNIEVTAPNNHMGDITSDLISKRGRIVNTDIGAGDLCVIHAQAPLSELMQYSNQLKSMTQGIGSFVIDYSHDEETPPNVQAEVVAAYSPQADED